MPEDLSSMMVASNQGLPSTMVSGMLSAQQFEIGARAFAAQAWPRLEMRVCAGSSVSALGGATHMEQLDDTKQLGQSCNFSNQAPSINGGSSTSTQALPRAIIASQWQVVQNTACTLPSNPLLGQHHAAYLSMADLPLPLGPAPPQKHPACSGAAGEASVKGLSGCDAEQADVEDLVVAEAVTQGQQAGSLDLHIVWHPSYQVPTLMMRPRAPGGTPLTLDALLAALPGAEGCSKQAGADWAFIAPQEHPVLQGALGRTGWYMLHPCQTAPVLALLLQDGGSQQEDSPATVVMDDESRSSDTASKELKQGAGQRDTERAGAETSTLIADGGSASTSSCHKPGTAHQRGTEGENAWMVRYFVAWFGAIVAPVFGIALQAPAVSTS